jgi:hypothetical protein
MIAKNSGMRAETGPWRQIHTLYVALWVAALANTLIPAVFFSDERFFGDVDFRLRVAVVAAVLGEYLIAFLFVLLHANVGFSSGYAVATSAVVTLGSADLAWTMAQFAGFNWSPTPGEILVLAGFAFAILANAGFFVASIRYARAVHPRLHLGGFFIGVAACAATFLAYMHVIR